MPHRTRTAHEFGDALRQQRKQLGLTQDELATRCGVGKRFIVEREAGKPSIQLEKSLIVAAELRLELMLGPAGGWTTTSVPAEAEPEDPLAALPRF